MDEWIDALSIWPCMYTLLGIIAGIIGAVISGIAWFNEAQFFLSIIAGSMMVTFGLHIAGLIPDPFIKGINRFYNFTGLSRWVLAAKHSQSPVSWYFEA